jgi:very-short-patch-repair endonuclease
MSASGPHEHLYRLASEQHGMISRDQARRLGVHRNTLLRWCAEGRFARDGSLLRWAAFRPSPLTDMWGAVLATGGVLSHESAASLLAGAGGSRPIHVTVRRGYVHGAPGWIRLHSSRRLPASHTVSSASGLRHTIAPRTFVDLAAPKAGEPDERLVFWLDKWTIEGAASTRWLEWWLETEAKWLPGRQRSLQLLRALGDEKVDSRVERELAEILRSSDLPPFVMHYPLVVDGRKIAVIDYGWAMWKVGLELDGYRFHSGPTAFVTDRRRGNEVELAGWMLLRTSPTQVRETPDEVLSAVHRAIELRGRSPEPPESQEPLER